MSHLIKKVTSVFDDKGIGAAILPTANKSWASLYKPTTVTYGENSLPEIDPVAKSFNIPQLSCGVTYTVLPPIDELYGVNKPCEPDNNVGL